MVDPQASRFWQAALQSGLLEAQGSDRLLGCDSAGEARRAGAPRPPAGTSGRPAELSHALAGAAAPGRPHQRVPG